MAATMAETWRAGLLTLLLALLSTNALAKSALTQLNEDNWWQILDGEWMVEFFAPWCPACKALQPVWEDFASWSDDLSIKVGQVDVTASPGLSGRFMVAALPTIYHVNEGEFRRYHGSRDKDEFISFIEEKKWKEVEKIPGWKSPASIQMSLVSYFFKLSMTLRSVHNSLVEDYGLPTWASYLVFAAATIIVGALLGLILVCIIDFVYPQKAAFVPKAKKEEKSEDEDKDEKDDDEAKDEDEEEDDDDIIEDDREEEGYESLQETQESKEAATKEDQSPEIRKRKVQRVD